MKASRFVFLSIVASLVLAGCGGNQHSPLVPVGANRGQGKATLTVKWPERSRLIPAASNSISVVVQQGTSAIAQKLLPRPATGNTSTVTFDPLPVGSLSVTANAYPNTNGTGTAQAVATVPLTIQAGQTTQFTVTMNTTITRLELSSPQLILGVGQSVTMGLAAKDAAANIVLLSPSKLQWQSSNRGVATVDTAGKVTGVAAGTTDISVTDTESNQTAHLTLTVHIVGPITFQNPVQYPVNAPNQVVTADFDGDGKVDIAVGTNSALMILYGKGDGTFESPQTILTWTGGITPYSVADMNGDGKPDLTCTVPGQFIVVTNQGGRQFAAPLAVSCNTEVGPLATGDFNGDGKQDVAIVAHDQPGSTSTHIYIFQNQGGSFTRTATIGNIWIILTIKAGDLNGDGKTDLLVDVITDIVGTSGASIYWGDGTGNFTGGPGVNTETGNTDWTVIADFNNDGRMDYAVANDYSGSVSVVLNTGNDNTGNDTFATPASYLANAYPDELAAADLDGDGWQDLIVENRGSTFLTVLRNQNALFPNAVQVPLGVSCGPIAVTDVNGDHKPDIIVSSTDNNEIVVLLNASS